MALPPDWPRWRPMIERALEYGTGTHTIEDIEADLAADKMAAICGFRSIIVCQIEDYPQRRELCVFAGCGDLKEIRSFVPYIRSVAVAFGCVRVTLRSKRKGFLRALRGLGMVPVQTLYSAEL